MEVFDDTQDPSIFYLMTRWTNVESFRQWHHSDAHRHSHQGIPRGLKLDRSFNQVLELQRLADSTERGALEQQTADQSPFFASFLCQTQSVHFLVVDCDGTIKDCNGPVAAELRLPKTEIVGTKLWRFLADTDAALLQGKVADGPGQRGTGFLLNFVSVDHAPYTLNCLLAVQPTDFVLLGEPAAGRVGYQEELLQLNNEFAVLSREYARKGRELEQALAQLREAHHQLENSFWHLKKIQEVLPVCMECGKVKSAEATWEGVVDYLKRNAVFLSHGYCPECAEGVLARFRLELKKGSP